MQCSVIKISRYPPRKIRLRCACAPFRFDTLVATNDLGFLVAKRAEDLFHERNALLLHKQARVSETSAIYGKIRTRTNLLRPPRGSFACETHTLPLQSEPCAQALFQRRIGGPSARDNSIVTTLNAYRARARRLREIKTNVPSLAHLHGARFVLRADG
jgi:hypothetical protein